MILLKCPSCSANMSVDNERRDFYFCQYCGAKILAQHTYNTVNNYYSASNRIEGADQMFKRWTDLYLLSNCEETNQNVQKITNEFISTYPSDYRASIINNVIYHYYNYNDKISAFEKLSDSEEKNRLLRAIKSKFETFKTELDDRIQKSEQMKREEKELYKKNEIGGILKKISIVLIIVGIGCGTVYQILGFFIFVSLGIFTLVKGIKYEREFQDNIDKYNPYYRL